MAFCHILVVMGAMSANGEVYDDPQAARNCNYDREVECVSAVKALPVGGVTIKGAPILASFCHPARRPPMHHQPAVTEKGSV